MRYEAAVPPGVADLAPRLEPEVQAISDEAIRELSRFDAEQGMEIAGFAPVLLRSEAASSSQIENLTASARAIFSAEFGARSGSNAELIAANTHALSTALRDSEMIDSQSIREIHRVLMEPQTRHPAGVFRDEQVWIGSRSDSPVGAEFVPPHHSRVPGLIEDLSKFVERNDVPVMAAVAISHAQFETIHPFTDGNGRTGRALVQAMFRQRGITQNVAVPVSAGILTDVPRYHQALTDYRNGDINPIVRIFAEAAFRAVENSVQLVDDLRRIRAGWDTQLTARKNSNAWRLLDILVEHPVLNSATAAAELGVAQPNIYPPLKTLVDAGIVKSKAEHGLGPFWRSDEILAAVDAFVQRAGRRRPA
ncbi:Fic family protein [Brevibacterium spongiae]|uniref:Fic family protein n=1 Tax=Brevibacterium spongiae TaxID=2909672 RepID=A0ABY5STK8_9MICO|nr:Fic family protein [Brevibacterium spongiae]UVI36366.1 Fic family protein [Brevibacterium spongiae]